MESKNPQEKNPLSNYIKYSGLGVQMILTICIAAWAGIKLDEYYQVESKLFTLSLLLFAVIASMFFVIRGLMKK